MDYSPFIKILEELQVTAREMEVVINTLRSQREVAEIEAKELQEREREWEEFNQPEAVAQRRQVSLGAVVAHWIASGAEVRHPGLEKLASEWCQHGVGGSDMLTMGVSGLIVYFFLACTAPGSPLDPSQIPFDLKSLPGYPSLQRYRSQYEYSDADWMRTRTAKFYDPSKLEQFTQPVLKGLAELLEMSHQPYLNLAVHMRVLSLVYHPVKAFRYFFGRPMFDSVVDWKPDGQEVEQVLFEEEEHFFSPYVLSESTEIVRTLWPTAKLPPIVTELLEVPDPC